MQFFSPLKYHEGNPSTMCSNYLLWSWVGLALSVPLNLIVFPSNDTKIFCIFWYRFEGHFWYRLKNLHHVLTPVRLLQALCRLHRCHVGCCGLCVVHFRLRRELSQVLRGLCRSYVVCCNLCADWFSLDVGCVGTALAVSASMWTVVASVGAVVGALSDVTAPA